MISTVVKVGFVVVEVVGVIVVVVVFAVVFIAVVGSVPFAVVVVSIGAVISVDGTPLSVVIAGVSSVAACVVLMVTGASVFSGRSLVVVSKGYTVVGKSSTSVKCLFVNLYNTYANAPMARMEPRPRRIERSVGCMLFLFSSDTWRPSLDSFTGWRKKMTLVSFPFISATEPRKTLHLQLVRV